MYKSVAIFFFYSSYLRISSSIFLSSSESSAFSNRSGLLLYVLLRDSFLLHLRIFSWLPERRTSGTLNPLQLKPRHQGRQVSALLLHLPIPLQVSRRLSVYNLL